MTPKQGFVLGFLAMSSVLICISVMALIATHPDRWTLKSFVVVIICVFGAKVAIEEVRKALE